MEIIADVVRSGFVEGHHWGTVVGVRGRVVEVARGDVGAPFLPRSALKPLQTVGMVRAGLVLDEELIALACSSHSGEVEHVAGVHRILADAGLSTTDLANAAQAPRTGRGPTDRVHAECSGKHAAMLATCVAAGWPVKGYLDVEHPLQVALRETVEELTGERVGAVAVEGCGAPAFAISPTGLARAFVRLGTEQELAPVAQPMLDWPQMVAGSGREVTTLLRNGLLAKDGAEGVLVVADRTGSAVVVKVADGSWRGCVPVAAAASKRVGLAWPKRLVGAPLLGGGGPVGDVVARPL